MKNKVTLAVALLLIVPLIAQLSFAQLFPNARWNRSRPQSAQYQSNCPGGVCPTVTNTVQRQNAFRSVQRSTHWTYPGASIASHLAGEHAAQLRAMGISTAGMSNEQLLSLHDALHENRVTIPNQTTRIPALPKQRVYNPLPQPRSATIPQPRANTSSAPISASNSTFGLSGGPATEAIPKHVLAQVETRTEVRSEFKSALLQAISDARKSGKITFREAVGLRVACVSPAFVERAELLAVTQVAFSGEASEHIPMSEDGMVQVDGINWQGLATFLEAFIPLLITLLKAFGLT